MTRNDRRINRIKTSVTLVGASAAVAMGIIGVAAAAGTDSQTAVVYAGSMSTGATSIVAYSETEATSVAVPVVKATPFGEG
jgi:lipid-binding SYLF domain-containing protein